MNPYPNFIGGSYQSQSPWADMERTINWYPELIEPKQGQLALYPTPGMRAFATVPETETRALFSMDNHTSGVVGAAFHELFATGATTKRGDVAQDNNPATITYNGAGGGEQFVTSGGNGYLFDTSSHAFTQVLTGTATMGAMLDGYFIAFEAATSTIRLSNLLDGTTWDPTQFAQRSIAPDPWRAMIVANREIWLVGEQTGEVWYDAGAFPFPFAPVPGSVFAYGIRAPWSLKTVGPALMWLSQNAEGHLQVVRAQGYAPQVVSTRAVELAFSQYERTSTTADAEALVYQDQGHVFYVLRFPSANATWVWDDTTQLWHERGRWNAFAMRFDAWRPRAHCLAFGSHLVGGAATGTISVLDVTVGSEVDGTVIRRVRVAPGVRAADQRLFNARFQLECEPGLGLASGQGVNPQVMLRTSKDAGKTWSHERLAGAGLMGEYRRRVFWTRNGSGRIDGVEVSVSDPIPWRISQAYVGLKAA